MKKEFKNFIIGITVFTLSGCTAGLRPILEDYKGSDAARIRTTSTGNTSLQFFEKQPAGCYKKMLERRITSGFSIIGLPVTGNKKIGMPPSSDNKGMFINEFTLKPDQYIKVIHYWTQQGYYQNSERSVSYDFIPQPNHDYDIIVTGSEFSGDNLNIKDLNPDANVIRWGDVKICQSDSIF